MGSISSSDRPVWLPRGISDGDPRLKLDGPLNFRDIGGYVTREGRHLRDGMVFRSDDLAELSQSDLGSLAKLGLRTVLDLRSDEEVARRGAFPVRGYPGSLDYRHLSLVDDVVGTRDSELDDQSYINERYQFLLDRGSQAIAQIFHLFADASTYPLVFHCVAGKDRTGVVAALLLAILDVPDTTIASDYQLTELATRDWFARVGQRDPEELRAIENVPRVLFTSEPSTMLTFLHAIRLQSGSVEAKLQSIGVGDDEIASIRRILLSGS